MDSNTLFIELLPFFKFLVGGALGISLILLIFFYNYYYSFGLFVTAQSLNALALFISTVCGAVVLCIGESILFFGVSWLLSIVLVCIYLEIAEVI